MRIGVMYANWGRQSPGDAVKAALLEWSRATHTNGFEASEVHFNPSELPPDPMLFGLVVVPDDLVSSGHVRLTTFDLGIEDEWSATMTTVRDDVEGLAAL